MNSIHRDFNMQPYKQALSQLKDEASKDRMVTPAIIAEFFAELCKQTHARTVLDPNAQFGAVTFEVCKKTNAQITSLCRLKAEYETTSLLSSSNMKIIYFDVTRCDIGGKYEIIVSDLLFGGNQDKDYFNLKVMEKCADILSDSGTIAATFLASVFDISRYRKAFSELEERGLHIACVIDLPSGTYSPYSQAPTKIILFSKHPRKERFIAQLSSADKINVILDAYINSNLSSEAKDGCYIDSTIFPDFVSLERNRKISKLTDAWDGDFVVLSEVALSFKVPNTIENEENSIFIPTVGLSEIITESSRLKMSERNYIQALLNPEKILARFAAFFFNSPTGQAILSEYINYHSRLTRERAMNLPVALFDVETQINILDTSNTIDQLESKLISAKKNLQKKPSDFNTVKGEVKKIVKTNSLKDWENELPFPLATILHTYLTKRKKERKRETSLEFFEALAEYISTILLSVANEVHRHDQSPSVFSKSDYGKLIERPITFGTWTTLNTSIAKKLRKLQSNNTDDYSAPPFSLREWKIIECLSNESLHDHLNAARIERNKYAHGVKISESLLREQVEYLNSLLIKIRNVSSVFFEETLLVKPGPCINRSGFYENDIEVVLGESDRFKESTLRVNFPLDVNSLYLNFVKSERVIKLPPLFILEQTDDSTGHACYFFSGIDTDTILHKSYHYHCKPEHLTPDRTLLADVEDICK